MAYGVIAFGLMLWTAAHASLTVPPGFSPIGQGACVDAQGKPFERWEMRHLTDPDCEACLAE
eukprot:gene8729-7941_t